jgi:hypothetical protein
MLQYLLLTMSVVLYLTGKPTHLYTKATNIHRKWLRLKRLVSSTENDITKIYSTTSKMVFQLMCIEIVNYFKHDSTRRVDKNTYEVSYELNSKSYKMLITPHRGPPRVIQVIDHDNIDITELVLPYLGPKFDWHGHFIKPSFFNITSMSLNWADGTTTHILN